MLFVPRQIEVAVRADPIPRVDLPVALRADLGIARFLFHPRAQEKIAPLFGAVIAGRLTGGGFPELVADTENAQDRAVGTLPVFRNRDRQFDAADRAGNRLAGFPLFRRELVTVRTGDFNFG